MLSKVFKRVFRGVKRVVIWLVNPESLDPAHVEMLERQRRPAGNTSDALRADLDVIEIELFKAGFDKVASPAGKDDNDLDRQVQDIYDRLGMERG